MLTLLILVLALGNSSADYDCLCTYIPQKPVYSSASKQSSVLGNLNENDCKEVATVSGLDPNAWGAIAFQHKIGYVEIDSETETMQCSGSPPSNDKLTTSMPGGGQQTTMKTMQPTTMKPTTMKPTTMPTKKTTVTMTTKAPMTTRKATTTMRPTTTRPAYTTVSSGSTQTHSQSTGLYGNTALCPTSVRQYAQQDREVIAQNGGSCYAIVPHRVSWTHAEGICNHRGGHLFHVSSSSENTFIYNLLNQMFNHSVWMGLHDIGHEEQFTWISGNPVTYTNWISGRKDNYYSHNVEDCSVFVPYINRGQWDDIPCGSSSSLLEPLYETHYFICQFGISVTQPTQTLSGNGNTNLCSAHVRYLANHDHATLAQHSNSCYEWINHRSSWTHAESVCSSRGGHLVQINDAQEEAFIQQFLTTHDSQHAIWIGLHDRGHEERFTWTSGEPVSYTNWVPGRKSNFQSHNTEDCVAFIPYKQGQWDDIACGSSSVFFGQRGETHPYICEFRINSATSGGGSIIG